MIGHAYKLSLASILYVICMCLSELSMLCMTSWIFLWKISGSINGANTFHAFNPSYPDITNFLLNIMDNNRHVILWSKYYDSTMTVCYREMVQQYCLVDIRTVFPGYWRSSLVADYHRLQSRAAVLGDNPGIQHRCKDNLCTRTVMHHVLAPMAHTYNGWRGSWIVCHLLIFKPNL